MVCGPLPHSSFWNHSYSERSSKQRLQRWLEQRSADGVENHIGAVTFCQLADTDLQRPIFDKEIIERARGRCRLS